MDTTSPAPSRQSTVIAVVTVMLIVMASTVGLRFYTRYALVRKVGVDDWAVGIAYVILPLLLVRTPAYHDN